MKTDKSILGLKPFWKQYNKMSLRYSVGLLLLLQYLCSLNILF